MGAMLLRLLSWVLHTVISLYILILIARCVIDWIQVLARWRPQGAAASLVDFVYQVTEPPLRALRKVFPPIPLGAVSFDTAFIILWVLLDLLLYLV